MLFRSDVEWGGKWKDENFRKSCYRKTSEAADFGSRFWKVDPEARIEIKNCASIAVRVLKYCMHG